MYSSTSGSDGAEAIEEERCATYPSGAVSRIT